jgi:hypothetical protein
MKNKVGKLDANKVANFIKIKNIKKLNFFDSDKIAEI